MLRLPVTALLLLAPFGGCDDNPPRGSDGRGVPTGQCTLTLADYDPRAPGVPADRLERETRRRLGLGASVEVRRSESGGERTFEAQTAVDVVTATWTPAPNGGWFMTETKRCRRG